MSQTASFGATPMANDAAAPTWGDFADAVLDAIGVPRSPGAHDAMLAWMAGEQPPSSPNATYNPLNIQNGDFAGKGYGQSAHGQWNFPDYATGVAAVARELNTPLYSGIKKGLASGDANAAAAAIVASPWAAGHYGGHLPLAQVQAGRPLYDAGRILANIGGNTTPAKGTPSAGGTGSGSGITLAGITNPLDALSGIGSLFSWAADPHNWLRLIVGTLGAAGIVVGVVLIANDLSGGSVSGATGKVTSAVKKTAELAAVA